MLPDSILSSEDPLQGPGGYIKLPKLKKRTRSACTVSAGASSVLKDVFALSNDAIENIEYVKGENGFQIITITLVPKYEPCPDCGHDHPHIKDYRYLRISHDSLAGFKAIIKFRRRRYSCPVCHKTYSEPNPFTLPRGRVSWHVVDAIIKELKNPSMTFTSVAARFGLSPTAVQNIFDRTVSFPPPRRLPRVLLIDEVHAFSSEYSDYVCVLLDLESQEVIDVLPQRRLEFLREYFSQFPLEEREKVQFCCSDMYSAYQTVFHEAFPNAVIAIDRYHVTAALTECVRSIRIGVMNRYPRRSDEYYLLKHHSELLTLNPRSRKKGHEILSPDAPTVYNRHFECHLNPSALLDMILEIDPVLEDLRDIVLTFQSYFRKEILPAQALEELESMILSILEDWETGFTSSEKFARARARGKSDRNKSWKIIQEDAGRQNSPEEVMPPLRISQMPWQLEKLLDTLIQWKREIANSFSVIDEGYVFKPDNSKTAPAVKTVRYRKHLTSSLIENRNRIIQIIKNNGAGYRNWKRFRNRVLHCLSSDRWFRRMEPSEENPDRGSRKG